MKKINLFILMLLALLCMNALQAQVNIGGTPKSYECEKNGMFLEPPVFVQTAPLDMAAIEAEDAQWEAERAAGMLKIGRRFGIEFEVQYDLYNSGTWTYFPDGSELWRLGVECPDALTINLIFDRYHLPAGATLYIYNAYKRDLIGGFTNYNNQDDYAFATDVVDGDRIIIEYYQPANTEFEAELRLGTIVHGYRGTLIYDKGFGHSQSCQRNTICPEGVGWENEIRSVFALYVGGQELCSGAILNNTANDKTPYALTANHCYVSNITNAVFRFRWESATCTPSTNNTNYKTMSGCAVKVRTNTNTSATDCMLLQLNQAIPADYDVYFAGWSRATTAPTSAVCIHHPALDIKKITLSSNISAVTSPIRGWRAYWPPNSCTEGGSSGSPLFDQNHRVVGQEQGGPACDYAYQCASSSNYDTYGRLDVSWTMTNQVSSTYFLKDFLDPLNLDPITLDGLDNLAALTDAELFEITVPAATYVEETIEPTVTIKNKGNTPITSATVSYTVDGGTAVTKTWTGTLSGSATATIKFDTVAFAIGTHTFTATVTIADDANPANDSKTVNFEVLAINIDAELLNVLIPKPIHYVAETIEPTITIKNSGNKAITAATVSYTIDEETAVTKEWTGTLAVGATTTVKFNPVTSLTLGTHTFNATVTVPNDANSTNDSKTTNFEIKDCLPVQNITIEDIENTITLKWEAPVNKADIIGYAVSIDGTVMDTVTVQEFTAVDLEQKAYEFCIAALYNYDPAWCTESPKECLTYHISVNEIFNNAVKIYPNPANSQIFVEGATVKSVEIYNLQGKLLYLQNGDLHKIDVSGFAAGNYLIRVSIENGQKITKQITIKR